MRALQFILLFISVISLNVNYSQAQTTDYESEPVVRAPTEEMIDDYLNDRRFQYQELDTDPESLWDRFILWLNQELYRFFTDPLVRDILEIFFYITFVIVAIALLRQFTKGDISSAFFASTSTKKNQLKYQENTIAAEDLENLIKAAIGNKKYDEALKLMFNRALQMLDEKELIQWKSDKTNHDYLYEISGHPSKADFFKLMLAYEYVEYGDFHLRNEDFNQISESYSSFRKAVLR